MSEDTALNNAVGLEEPPVTSNATTSSPTIHLVQPQAASSSSANSTTLTGGQPQIIRTIPSKMISLTIPSELNTAGTIQIQRAGPDVQVVSNSISQNQLNKLFASTKLGSNQVFKHIQVPFQASSSLSSPTITLNQSNLMSIDKSGKTQPVTLITGNSSERSTACDGINSVVTSNEDTNTTSSTSNCNLTSVSMASVSTATTSSNPIVASTGNVKNPVYKVLQLGSKLKATSDSSSNNVSYPISSITQTQTPISAGVSQAKPDKKEAVKKVFEIKSEIFQQSSSPTIIAKSNLQPQKVIIRGNDGKITKMLNSKTLATLKNSIIPVDTANLIRQPQQQQSTSIINMAEQKSNSNLNNSINHLTPTASKVSIVATSKGGLKRNYSKIIIPSTDKAQQQPQQLQQSQQPQQLALQPTVTQPQQLSQPSSMSQPQQLSQPSSMTQPQQLPQPSSMTQSQQLSQPSSMTQPQQLSQPSTLTEQPQAVVLNDPQLVHYGQQNPMKPVDSVSSISTCSSAIQTTAPIFNTVSTLNVSTSTSAPSKRTKRANSTGGGTAPKRSRSTKQLKQTTLNFGAASSVSSIPIPNNPITFMNTDVHNNNTSTVSSIQIVDNKSYQLISSNQLNQFPGGGGGGVTAAAVVPKGPNTQFVATSSASSSSQASNFLISQPIFSNPNDGNFKNLQIVSTGPNSNGVSSSPILLQLGNGAATDSLPQQIQFLNTTSTSNRIPDTSMNSKLQQVLQQQQQQPQPHVIEANYEMGNMSLVTPNPMYSMNSSLPGVPMSSSASSGLSSKSSALASALASTSSSVVTMPLSVPSGSKSTMKEQIDRYEYLIKESFNPKNVIYHNHCQSSPGLSSINKLWSPILQNDFDKSCCSVSSFRSIPFSDKWKTLISPNNVLEIKLLVDELGPKSDGIISFDINSLPTLIKPNDNGGGNGVEGNTKTIDHQGDSDNDHFWFVTVVKTAGYYICVRFFGLESSSSDFWINLRQRDLYRLHYAKENGFSYRQPAKLTNVFLMDSSLNPKLQDLMKSDCKTTLPFDSLYQEFSRQLNDGRLAVGTRVEALDKSRLSLYRVGTVDQVVGDRVHVIYDGETPDDKGLWTHPNHGYIRPVGWSQMVGHPIYSSSGYVEKSLQKSFKRFKRVTKMFEDEHAEVVAKETKDERYKRLVESFGLFNDCEVFNPNAQVRKGMKLEVIDPLNLSTIAAATVERVLRFNFLLISIDSTEDTTGIDWFCAHLSSPYLLPPGFSGLIDYPLSTLSANFDWETHLNDKDVIPIPQQSLTFLDVHHGFQEGMLLEAVDLIEPNLICVAVIKKVAMRLLLLHFIGWGDAYNQWCDCSSPNIYPIGWCDTIDYPLQGPQSLKTNVGGGNDGKKKKQLPNRRKRKSNASTSKWKTSTAIVNRKFSDPPTYCSTYFDKEELKKFSKLTLEEMFNMDRSSRKAAEDEANEAFNEHNKFQVDNQIKNEKPFYEFNTFDTVNSPYIVLSSSERLEFRQNLGPIEYKFKHPQYDFTLDDPQVRVQALEKVGFLDTLPMSRSKCFKFLYRKVECRAETLADMLKWDSYQVAKFLMDNDFDEIYDEVINSNVNGQKLYNITMELATKLTGGIERRSNQLYYFVQKLRQIFSR